MNDDQYIPIEQWGKDHWSTLSYIETRLVEGPLVVAFDQRMRQKRRNFRVLAEALRPGSPEARQVSMAVPMDSYHGTRLYGGTSVVSNHDDWDCVQDAVAAGLFEGDVNNFEAGFPLKLTAKGYAVVADLRRFKASGGSYHTYRYCKPENSNEPP